MTDRADERVLVILAADAWQAALDNADTRRASLIDTIDHAIAAKAISEREAAQLVGISRDTLRRWRRDTC
jgi:predicted XRE-type DNA-binding protein